MVAILGIALVGSEARAQSVEQFYRGNRINLVVGSTAGGGYDLYARLIARHLPKHIPGQPSIVVQNMIGAGGVKSANYLYGVGPQDGSVVALLQNNNAFLSFYEPGNKAFEFDPRKFHWLGSPQQEVGLFVMTTKTGLKSVEDIKSREFTVSSVARNSPSTIYANMINATYGSKLKIVMGYSGVPTALLAVERGEVEGHLASASSAAWRRRMAPWIEKGEAKLLMQMAFSRDSEYPDVPTAIELVDTPRNKQILEIAFAPQITGRPFALGPGVPADRVKALRTAFDLTMKDPEFLENAKAQSIEINPVSGEQIVTLLDRVFSTPPALAEQIRGLAK
jgi:tripartite-type tricarboxylate transporter receptor subunit TctC